MSRAPARARLRVTSRTRRASAMRRPPNIAAAAARWSAEHRRKAIGGWLVFVLAAFLVGGAVGQRYLTDAQMGNGESGRVARAIDAADFPKLAHEQVLVQGRGAEGIGDPHFISAVLAVVARLERVPYARGVKSPLLPAYRGQVSRDGRSALVTFDLLGTQTQVKQRVVAALDVIAAVQHEHPALRVEEF